MVDTIEEDDASAIVVEETAEEDGRPFIPVKFVNKPFPVRDPSFIQVHRCIDSIIII